MTGRGGCGGGGGRVILGRVRGRGGRINFNISNNQNNRQRLKFYLRVTGTDQYTVKFTKVKEHLISNIQSESVNGSDIAESIRKGVILDLSN